MLTNGAQMNNPLKTFILGAWINILKPIICKTCILSKLLHRFQPNFAQWKRPPKTLRGWSKHEYKNPWSPFKKSGKIAINIKMGQVTLTIPYRNRFSFMDQEWLSAYDQPINQICRLYMSSPATINVPFQHKNMLYRGQGLGWRFSSARLRMANDIVTSRLRCLFVQQRLKLGKDRRG